VSTDVERASESVADDADDEHGDAGPEFLPRRRPVR
jgi:hypothetical protein